MGQILHGNATTTAAIRRTIQNSQESLIKLSKRFGINPKTVDKWRKRDSVEDLKTGPKNPRSTVLSVEEEAMIVAFRRYSLLPLDDCLYSLQPTIPHLTRSSLHRCFQRHNISRLPQMQEAGSNKPKCKQFKTYPIGYFHIDIAQLQTSQGKLYMFVAIDRTSKFALVELVSSAGKMQAAQFLQKLIETVPYKIHTILTDNGIQFTNRKKDKFAFEHIFTRTCIENNIEHRLTQINHPWTNGQVERMNRTIKEATVKSFHYDNHEQLRSHLQAFMDAYNLARRLKTLKGLTPHEFICKIYQNQPKLFKQNPYQKYTGLYIWIIAGICQCYLNILAQHSSEKLAQILRSNHQ